MRCIGTLAIGVSLGVSGCTATIGGGDPGGGDGSPSNPAGTGGTTSGIPGGGGSSGAALTPEECAVATTPSVGVAPLRRLTRSQYSHTIRDLLGLPGDHGAKLALDEKVGLFFS